MAKERLKSPRVRLFVALDLPEPVLEGVATWQEAALAGREGWRPLHRDAMHVTLAFLGWTPERRIETVVATLGGVEPVAVRMRLAPEPIALPSKRRARVLALAVDSERAASIQRAISERLASERLYEPEKREYRPHLTIARRRDPSRRTRRRAGGGPQPEPPRIGEPPPSLPEQLTEPFDAVRVALYRSDLRPEGARYVRLSDVELPPSAAER